MMHRRSFLKLGAAGALSMSTGKAFASLQDRKLSLYNIHTGEELETTYWSEGSYVGQSLGEIDHVLRDFRTGDAISMDTRLLDLLHSIRTRLGGSQPFHVISGYRSPKTNAMLRSESSGVAKHSLHMQGMAADICLPGRDLSVLHQVALDLGLGGVGYYPRSNFVHVDVGRVRYWHG